MGENSSRRRFIYYFAALFLGLAISIAAIGYAYYEKEATFIKKGRQEALSAIADLKVGEISMWRAERLGDAGVLYDSRVFSSLVLQWLTGPGPSNAEEEVRWWLNSLKKRYDYESVLFIDAAGEVRLSIPDGTRTGHSIHEIIEQGAAADRPIFLDLHRSEVQGSVHLGVMIPIFPSSTDRTFLGMVILRIDPRRFLYPLIQTWPTPSDSAETLLVRRDGDEVVFLNELRFRKNTALTMRLPVKDADLPAARAVRGSTDPMEGVDYRGVPVLACARAVPGSPWFMVAKVDLEEIYSPVRTRARTTFLLAALLVAAVGAAIGLVWNRQNGEFYRRQYETEAEKLNLAQRYEQLMKRANDIILLLDGEGKVLEANARAVAAYGYPEKELIGMDATELRHPESRDSFAREKPELHNPRGGLFETVHRRKDGSAFPVELSTTAVSMGQETAYLAIVRDVSERKQAEARIRRLNRLYSCLSEINQAVVRVRDRDRLLQETCRIAVEYGQFGMAWIGLADADNGMFRGVVNAGCEGMEADLLRFPLDDNLEMYGSMGCAVRTGGIAVCNTIDHTLDGAPWHGVAMDRGLRSSAAVPLRVEGETVAGFECYSMEPDFFDPEEIRLIEEMGADISFGLEIIRREAHKELVEAKLKESEAAYRTIFENTGTATIIIEEEGTVSLANRKFGEISGFVPEEVEGVRTFADFVDERDLELVEERHRLRRTQPAAAPSQYELRIVDRSGNVRDVYTTVAMIPGTLKSVASIVDITQMKATEIALKESEAKYRELVENASSIILRLDTEGRIVFFNRYAQQFFCYGEEEILGRHLPGTLLAPRFESENDAASPGGFPLGRVQELLGTESEAFKRNGDPAWIAWTNRQVFDADGKLSGLLCIGNDITQQKLLGEQYRQAQKMEAVGRLAGGIAHDFNNLLGVITGYSEVSLLGIEPGDRLRESIEHIRSAALRAANLTRQLLAFSRKQVLEPRVMDLNTVVAETEKMLRRLIGEDVELVTHLAADLSPIKIDPGQIEQVIMNLAVNARDAMPEGGKLTIETTNVELDKRYVREHLNVVPGQYVMLAVSDTGMGMDHETLSHIFEPFFTTKERDKGTGLGLSTVYGIVQQSNGYIYVYSEPRRGTAFKLYFPAMGSEKEVVATRPDRRPDLKGTETALVVEDETTMREIIREILERFGYRVLCAADPREALDTAAKCGETIHILVTDVVMPVMSGRVLSELLKRSRPEMRTLYISGYTDNAIVHHGVLDQGLFFLQKPFTVDALVRKVREILDEA